MLPGDPPDTTIFSHNGQFEQWGEERELIQSERYCWLHAAEVPRVVDWTLEEDVEGLVLTAVASATMDVLLTLTSAVGVVMAVLVLVLVLVVPVASA